MIYELKYYDLSLVRFSATEDTNTPDIKLLWCNEEKKDLLPLDLELTGEGLALIAFTGYGSSIRTSLASCPEFTTNGMLHSHWRTIRTAILRYKNRSYHHQNTR